MSKANSFLFEIISPQGILFNEEVNSVSVPTYNGIITILPHHTPLFTKLAEGEVEIKINDKIITIVISGGFLEIKQDSTQVLADYAIRAESIEVAKSEEKKRLAEDKLKQKTDNTQFAIADKDLRISILELKVAQKIRKRQRN